MYYVEEYASDLEGIACANDLAELSVYGQCASGLAELPVCRGVCHVPVI
jgi:hypothetical protein